MQFEISIPYDYYLMHSLFSERISLMPMGLVGLTTEELSELAVQLKAPPYRGKQLSRWIYRRFVADVNEMSDLPETLRSEINHEYSLNPLRVATREKSPDGVEKYLFEMMDGERIESVYLPYPDRVSICISTQAGCPVRCAFCATGSEGLSRNLTPGEIVGQALALQREHPERRISHIVYMGMGEPLLNYNASLKSVRLLINEVGLSARHITISTVGIPDGIRKLATESVPVTLALSLHAPYDQLRTQLIPTAKKWRLSEILQACREYFDSTGRNLTFEYLLLEGVNDLPEQAESLATLLEGLPGNVNLIPYNPVKVDRVFHRPDSSRILAFRERLERRGRTVTQRMERGGGISAACGQLRRHAFDDQQQTTSVALER